jgi:hypothetical protein
MELKDFDESVARDVINKWEKHLGFFWSGSLYFEAPKFLVEAIKKSYHWNRGFYDDIIGSRYTDDSRLIILCAENQGFFLKEGRIQIIKCDVMEQTLPCEDFRQEAKEAERISNEEMMRYLLSFSGEKK